MGKKALKLDVEQSSDYSLIGIVTAENDYRLCWLINHELEIALQRINDFTVKTKVSSTMLNFPMFTYFDEDIYLKYYLVKNKHNNAFLDKDLKHVDYFMQILGEIRSDNVQEIITSIRKIPTVNTAFKINEAELKSKDLFMFQ